MLATLPQTILKDRSSFERMIDKAAEAASLRLPAPVRKAILAALSERDETAEVCPDKDGHPEPDPELRDSENVPLKEDVQTFFAREVTPHVPDAWINTAIRDDKDKQVGKVGYEINFNRHFYTYQPPRPLEAIEADIKVLEAEILNLLREVAG
jgi:type I restriction enzyme M protein